MADPLALYASLLGRACLRAFKSSVACCKRPSPNEPGLRYGRLRCGKMELMLKMLREGGGGGALNCTAQMQQNCNQTMSLMNTRKSNAACMPSAKSFCFSRK